MAPHIKDHNKSKVVDIASARGRGRPKKAETVAKEAAANAAIEAAQDEYAPIEVLLEARKHCKTAEDAQALDVRIAEARAETNAPSFGHNQLDPGGFLRWVQKLNAHEDKGDEIKAKLKAWRTDRKLLRKEANGAGIMLGQMDEALVDLKTEQVDLIEREQRRRDYHEWLGIPLAVQGKLLPTASIDPEHEAKRWFKRGDVDGRLGKERKLPVGIPPEHAPHYLAGHESGTAVLQKSLPLTAGAFDAAGKMKDKDDPKPVVADEGKLVTFGPEHFQTGTELTEANLKSLMDGHHEAFHNAEIVRVVYGDKVRVIKEFEDDGVTVYQDTGDPDVLVSEPEPVSEFS